MFRFIFYDLIFLATTWRGLGDRPLDKTYPVYVYNLKSEEQVLESLARTHIATPFNLDHYQDIFGGLPRVSQQTPLTFSPSGR